MPDWLFHLWQIQEVRAATATLSVTAVTAVIGKIITAKPRIKWGILNSNHFMVPQLNANPLSVLTRSFTVLNQGRRVAESVEIVLNWKPPHIEHFPHIPVSESLNADNRYVLTVARLNPKESVNFSMLSSDGHLPDITYVRASGYAAKKVTIAPQRIFPKWFAVTLGLSALWGFASVFYFIALWFV